MQKVPRPSSVMFHMWEETTIFQAVGVILLKSPLRQEKKAKIPQSKNILVLVKVSCSNPGLNQQTLKPGHHGTHRIR